MTTKEGSNIVPHPLSEPAQATSGGDGGEWDARFARIESRLTALETHVQYLATKEDVQKVLTQVEAASSRNMRWLVGVLAAGIFATLAALLRTFMGS